MNNLEHIIMNFSLLNLNASFSDFYEFPWIFLQHIIWCFPIWKNRNNTIHVLIIVAVSFSNIMFCFNIIFLLSSLSLKPIYIWLNLKMLIAYKRFCIKQMSAKRIWHSHKFYTTNSWKDNETNKERSTKLHNVYAKIDCPL